MSLHFHSISLSLTGASIYICTKCSPSCRRMVNPINSANQSHIDEWFLFIFKQLSQWANQRQWFLTFALSIHFVRFLLSKVRNKKLSTFLSRLGLHSRVLLLVHPPGRKQIMASAVVCVALMILALNITHHFAFRSILPPFCPYYVPFQTTTPQKLVNLFLVADYFVYCDRATCMFPCKVLHLNHYYCQCVFIRLRST